METNRGQGYIKFDFGVLDTGIWGCIPMPVLLLYLTIRRHVWRSLEAGAPRWRSLFKQGHLAASVTQTELGEYFQREKKTINEYMPTLKKLGWVKVLQDPDCKRAASYIIGERLKTGSGKHQESFFADQWVNELWDRIYEAGQTEEGQGSNFNALPWDRKREICEQLIAETYGEAPSEAPIIAADTPVDPPEFDQFCTEQTFRMPGKTDNEPDSSIPGTGKKRPMGPGKNGLTYGEAPAESRSRISKSLRDYNRKPEHISGELGADPERSSPSRRAPAKPGEVCLPEAQPQPRRGTGEPARSEGPEHVFKKKEVSAEVSQLTQFSSTDEPDVNQRLARLTAVAEGEAPAALDPNGETYKARVERARQQQADRAQAKEAKLRNFDGNKPTEVRQAIKHLEGIWSAESKAKFGPIAGAWQPSDRKMVEGLLKSYKPDLVAGAIKYLLASWDGLNKRMFKGNGGKIPTISVIARLHATIIPESVDYTELSVIAEEWQTWWDQHPSEAPPDDLSRRYQEALPRLKAIGAA